MHPHTRVHMNVHKYIPYISCGVSVYTQNAYFLKHGGAATDSTAAVTTDLVVAERGSFEVHVRVSEPHEVSVNTQHVVANAHSAKQQLLAEVP
jgi:hypothetical protein